MLSAFHLLQSSSLHKQLMLIANLLSFCRLSKIPSVRCSWFAFAVKVMMWCLYQNMILSRNAWCVLCDSAKYLCLLHHTETFLSFSHFPHRCQRRRQFVAFIHISTIPLHHHLESFVWLIFCVMKNSSFFTICDPQPVLPFLPNESL